MVINYRNGEVTSRADVLSIVSRVVISPKCFRAISHAVRHDMRRFAPRDEKMLPAPGAKRRTSCLAVCRTSRTPVGRDTQSNRGNPTGRFFLFPFERCNLLVQTKQPGTSREVFTYLCKVPLSCSSLLPNVLQTSVLCPSQSVDAATRFVPRR